MIKFLKSGFAVLSGNLSISVSNFIISGILISKNGLENYGLFVVLQSCYLIWMTLSKPITWQTIVKYAPVLDLRTLTKASLKIELASALLSTAILSITLTLASLYFTWIPDYLGVILAIASGSILVNNGTLLGYLRANRNYSTVAFIQTFSAALKILTSIILSSDIQLYFITTILIDIVLWGLAILHTIYKNKTIHYAPPNQDVRFSELVKFSFWGTFHAVLDLPVTQLDKVLISSLIGLEAAGVLDIIKKLSQVAGQFAAPIYQVIFPEYSKLIYEQKTKSLIKLSTILSIAILSCGVVLVVSTYVGFDLLNRYAFSNELNGHKHELIIYLAVQSLALCFIWVHPLCISLGKMRQTSFILIISNTLYLGTIYLFAMDYSIAAVIFAFTLQSSTLIIAKLYIILSTLKTTTLSEPE